ncbi:MAG: putative bifunctional diguanylate cyclase/phosphodiesterase [Friedmanniella sp.]
MAEGTAIRLRPGSEAGAEPAGAAGGRPVRYPHAWWAFLLLGTVAIGIYQLLPDGVVLDGIYIGLGLLATVAVLVGTWWHRPPRRPAWIALATSQGLWVLADIVGSVQEAVAPTDAFPTLADVFYLAGYPALALSLFLLTRGRRPRRDLEGALDSVTVAGGLYLLCWVLLARPTAAQSRDSWLAAVVGAAYPLLDITIIGMLVALVITPGTRTRALRLLVVAIGLVIVADTAATALGLLALGSTGPIDFIWMLSYIVIGAAALHPSMYELSAAPPGEAAVVSRSRRIATAVAVLVAPGTLAVQHAFGLRMDVWAVVVASVVMFLLVVARMNVAIQQIVAADEKRDRAQRELAHQAAHDSLTGLPNRAQALRLITGSLSRAQRSGAMVGLLFVDLDGFKSVNDTFGHRAGDEVLRATALRMQQAVRAGDMVGRLGGDEFVVLLEPVVDEGSAVAVGERLIAEVSKPITLSRGHRVQIGASVGVAISQDAQTEADALLVEADTAAYRAKNLGRGRTEVFDADLRRELHARAELERGLRTALAEEQLMLRYQPILDLSSGAPTGYEAVAQWRRPGVGVLPVPEIRPDAESSDLIFDLDAWAMRAAARQIARWMHEGHPPQRVSVRVSVRHAGRPRLLTDVRTALAESGIEAWQLVVQVSDTDLVDDAVVFANLDQLRQRGTTVSLDDFGLGYSSVRRLHGLPVNAVKLDRSLFDRSAANLNLLPLIVRGIHGAGLEACAKGVQNADDLELARSVGCEFGQGEYLGSLLDADQVFGSLAGSLPGGS